jgi:CRP/FNR family cyclic AMP-dependent transcriptional regulator
MHNAAGIAEEPLSGALRRSGWAAGLSEAEFDRVACAVFERRYPAGALIAAKGELPDHWLGVLAGMVKVDTNLADGKSTTFSGVAAGGWLGEGSLLKQEARPYEVIALQDTRMAFMPRATFAWLHASNLAFNHFLVSQLNARLGQFIALLERSRLHAMPELVAFGLASLLDPALSPSADDRVCISQEELGRLCGVSRQVAARGLHKLVEDGVIRMAYGAIEVRDRNGLRSAAGI